MSLPTPIAIPSLETMRLEANSLRKAANFAQAAPIFEAICRLYPESCTAWDYWGLAQSLYKQKQYAQALAACRKGYPLSATCAPLRSTYAWSIYYYCIATGGATKKTEILKGVKGVVRLCKQDDAFSPYTLAILKAASALGEGMNYPAQDILDLLALLDSKLLNADAFKPKDGKYTLASDLEQYYMHRIKSLQEAGDFEACITECKAAAMAVQSPNYSNQVWWQRTIALCQHAQGHTSSAIGTMKKVWEAKKDWFVAADLATFHAVDVPAEALRWASKAMMMHGDVEKKLKVLKLIGKLCRNMDYPTEVVCKHYNLAAALREYHGWRPDTEITLALVAQESEASPIHVPVDATLRELKPIWQQMQYKGLQMGVGTIDKWMPSGKAGFIKAENGRSYYFDVRNCLVNPQKLMLGSSVKYYLEEGYDAKKSKVSIEAVGIEQA